MRTLRLSLAGAVILALLGGMGGAVLAQDEEAADSMRPRAVTISFAVRDVSDGTVQVDAGGKHERGVHALLNFYKSSDPRLLGDVTYLGNLDTFKDGSSVHTETYEIVNDGGRWFGTATGMEVPDKVWGDFVLLRGEGDYAGLSALLFIDALRDEVNGVIFPGELPPVPEPPAE